MMKYSPGKNRFNSINPFLLL